MPPEAASPQIYCAMLISETWKHFHRRYPGVHNQKAAEAAHIYWLTCGKDSEAAHWRKLFSEEKSGRRKGSDPLSRCRTPLHVPNPNDRASGKARTCHNPLQNPVKKSCAC
jgi:hypothetical protein